MSATAKIKTMTTAQAAVRTLAVNGIDTVYCLPGVQNNFLFDALYGEKDKIRSVHTRHEQGAAYMALGAAMATGRPAVFSVVPGPGVLNTTAALSTAYACTAPVMCLTGQIPSAMIGRGVGMLHELPDQLAVMKLLTKWADRIKDPADAVPKVEEGFRQLLSGRPRPVSVECAMDIWPKKADIALPTVPVEIAHPQIDSDVIKAAAKLLGTAKRPMIVVGAGAQDASTEIEAISSMLQAPVMGHRMGLGILDSRNPLSINAAVGYKLWEHADVVLGVGTRLQMQQMQWGTDDDLKIVRIDVDPVEIDRIKPATVGIVAPALPALRELIGVLPQYLQKIGARGDEIAALKKETMASLVQQFAPQAGFLAAIRDELPENGIFVDELTQLGYVSRLLFPVYKPRTFISPGYQGTLGWGVATALGVKDAKRDTPVVLVTGDGGFMFNVQELATAVQHRIPAVIVLMNDNAFGNVRRSQVEDFNNRTIGSDLKNPDFMKLAESFGLMGLRATSPEELRGALRKAFKANGPVLIEVPVGSMPSPWTFFYPPKLRPKSAT
jgi:acetolactate synthase I/II/III large subunit